MKFIEKKKLITVDYFGLEVQIFDYGYLAVDYSGRLHWFDSEPYRFIRYWDVQLEDYELKLNLGKVDLEGLDWKESLMKIDILIWGQS